MVKIRFGGFVWLGLVVALEGCARQEPAEVDQVTQGSAELVVADFDSGQKPNNLGGDFGTWNKDESDPTQICTMGFDGNERWGPGGYSVKLTYDVDSPQPAYNGFWMKLVGLDASSYGELRFFTKGDRGAGYTSQFKIELKNTQGEVARYLVQGLTDQWQEIRVPLAKLRGMTDWSQLTEFVIVFDDINATAKTGTVYVDQISFVGHAQASHISASGG